MLDPLHASKAEARHRYDVPDALTPQMVHALLGAVRQEARERGILPPEVRGRKGTDHEQRALLLVVGCYLQVIGGAGQSATLR